MDGVGRGAAAGLILLLAYEKERFIAQFPCPGSVGGVHYIQEENVHAYYTTDSAEVCGHGYPLQ